ncbi:unnamed protein product [Bursaphelenchus xylophilus]|uniref:(pine wood nematode) hypothetical protein n=1 Tax=Bursaphelenchus xylophilus TaxID=6326 RepID=A0A1I7RSQ2_BURXY|nr:unnamed protein product [Bursaphelenchus xylophilus]CAG9122840.1 unnamed protein product [Bursaphelenchus xylophilus]
MNQHDFNTLLIDFVREEDVLYRSQNLNFTNSAERHMAYERIAEKLRRHGATYEQTHRLNEKFLKLKWRYMKEYHQVEEGKQSSWPYYESLSFLLPSVLELERKRLTNAEEAQNREHPPPPQPMPSNQAPPAPQQQFVEVQTCEVMPTSSNGTKSRTAQKRKNQVMLEETDTRLMEKRRVTNQAFADFVACKLDEMPEPIRTYTERQIIDVVMSVHVETYQEISQSGVQQMHHGDREIPIATEVYHPNSINEQPFDHCQTINATVRPRATRTPRKPKNDL